MSNVKKHLLLLLICCLFANAQNHMDHRKELSEKNADYIKRAMPIHYVDPQLMVFEICVSIAGKYDEIQEEFRDHVQKCIRESGSPSQMIEDKAKEIIDHFVANLALKKEATKKPDPKKPTERPTFNQYFDGAIL